MRAEAAAIAPARRTLTRYPTQLGGNALAAAAILNATETSAVVLVAWEHINIQYLAADLGVPKVLNPVRSQSLQY